MIRRHLLLASIAGLSITTHRTMAHGPTKGRNGGQMLDMGNNHVELVAALETLTLYVLDADDKPIDSQGVTATATVLAAGKQEAVTFQPAGGNTLIARGKFSATKGMRVAVSLTLPGQRPVQARFTPLD